MATCKAIHYELDLTNAQRLKLKELGIRGAGTDTKKTNEIAFEKIVDAQWINCDIREIDFRIFRNMGVTVVMTDPPWDIHMDLPYGTMADDEMRNISLQHVHDTGMLFLWVTGRALELGRECMDIWGYKRVEEIVWVKTNQLQRLIRTGRTGHWLNHSKEHCIVGVKGDVLAEDFNRNIDCDVLVSEVRETSRKPDEIYNMIERMWPNSMKLELFGRAHNTMPNWITLGNQLQGVNLIDATIHKRFCQMTGVDVPRGVPGGLQGSPPPE